MRILFILLFIFLFQQKSLEQNDNRNSDETLSQLTKNVFKYSSFQPGTVFYKDSTKNDAKLNYDRIFGKILYLDRMGKSVALDNPETVAMVTIAKDTFCFFDTTCVLKYTHFNRLNLYVRQTIVYAKKHNSGERNNMDPVVITNGSGLPYNKEEFKDDDGFNKNSMFRMINDYYIADKNLNYRIVTKKNVLEIFPSQKDKLKKYLKDNDINFDNASDIEKLLQYMNSL